MLPTSATAAGLRWPGVWNSLLEATVVDGRQRRRLGAYRELWASGSLEQMVAGYVSGRLELSPPVRHHVNKSDGRKKVVFTLRPADELLLKGLNRVLQPIVEPALSRLCHSFRPGRGPRSAYREIFTARGLDRLACLHVDVRDYFNSIPIDSLLSSLPPEVSGDRPLMRLLTAMLRDPRVVADGEVVADPHKGVMAGTPLAPLLSNLYLRSLDSLFEGAGFTYVRYADDILVLAEPSEIGSLRDLIERHLGELGLGLNERKTRLAAPGEPWEFLGFRYHAGSLDVAPTTAARLRRRARRIARRAVGRPGAAAYCLRRLNRRIYGVGGRREDFSWAGWFFPLLSRTSTLANLDHGIQGQLRFAVTGVPSRRNVRPVPYVGLRRAGYLPLVTAYYAYRRGLQASNLIAGRVL